MLSAAFVASCPVAVVAGVPVAVPLGVLVILILVLNEGVLVVQASTMAGRLA